MSELVERLSQGHHPVQISTRPEPTLKALKDSIDRGHVLVRFTNTRGGTELSVPLDRERTDTSKANLDEGTGRLTLVGDLMLDYVDVRCVAEIDLPALCGEGHLEKLRS
jgi:hypothetical protein